MDPTQDHNRRAWDRLAQRHQRFTRPAEDQELARPLATVDPNGWLGDSIKGWNVLCLAAGGGRQGPLYAAAGASVTVVDISAWQLERDRQVAANRRLDLTTVETSMEDLGMFREGQFDLVIHPVATCYIRSLQAVYGQVARVLRPQGLYISQHKQPTSLQTSSQATGDAYQICSPYYLDEPLPQVTGSLHREEGTLEFLHRWEQLIGQMCHAGFVIEDLVEPLHADRHASRGTFKHRSYFVAPYVRIKARRTGSGTPRQRITIAV